MSISSLADALLARTRRPTMTVWLDGRRWPSVWQASVDQSLGSNSARGTLTGVNPPVTPTPGMSVRWQWGYNGFEQPAFRGFVVIPTQQAYPGQWVLECQDVLWRASLEEQELVTDPLNSITAQAAIQYLLATYGGNPAQSIPTITLGGSAWTLGTLTPVRWASTTALAACDEIARTAGYWLFADAGGTVRARQVERKPSDSPLRTLTGGDAAGASLLVQGAPARRRDGNQVRNRITVRGANTGVEGAQLVDQFLATHALYPGVIADLEYSSFLLETIDDCTAVASRLAALWNRVPDTITASIVADPRFAVGATVAIREPRVGFPSARNFFIYALSTRIDLERGSFTQELTLDGGTGDGGFSTIPNPVAVLSATMEREGLNGTTVVVVDLDGSGSYSQSSGEIVAWAFSTTSPVVSGTPSSSTAPHGTPRWSFVFPASSSPASVSLTVTDTSSKTDTVTIELDLVGDASIVQEVISVAFGAAWEVSPDGGLTWNVETSNGDATLVPAIGAGVWPNAPAADSTAGLLATRATGSTGLRRTIDLLGSASTNLASLGGQVTALFVNPRNASRVWAAVGQTVYRSLDGGQTFTSWGVPAAGQTVRDILEDPALQNSVFCLAGATMYQSLGASPAWSAFYVGPSGATARWLCRSEDGTITWIAYTGTFSGSPLHRVEGPVTVTFPVLSPAVSEIRALALSDMIDPAAPTLLAADQAGRLWSIDGRTGLNVTQSTQTASGTVQHLLHSRAARLVYLADFDSVASGTGAVRKWLYQADRLLLFRQGATGRQAHMIGLGTRGRGGANLLQLPSGASGSADYLFANSQQTGLWRTIALPRSSWYWLAIKVDVFNPRRWLLLGNSSNSFGFRVVGGVVRDLATGTDSPLWLSEDAGATWSQVTLTHPWATNDSSGNACILYTFTTGWQQSQAGWFVYGSSNGSASAGQTHWIWRSNTTSAAAPAYESGGEGSACVGRDNDVIVTRFDGSFVRYWPGAGGGSVAIGSVAASPSFGAIDTEPGGSGLATGYAFGTLFVSNNYRSGGLSQRGSLGVGGFFQWATHGLYSARPNDPVRVDPATGATTPIPGYASRGSSSIAVDRQSRSVVAWRVNDGAYVVYDGSTVVEIAPPASMGAIADAALELYTESL